MEPLEIAFTLARLAIVVMCFITLIRVRRYLRERDAGQIGPPRILFTLVNGVVLAAALLTLNDAWQSRLPEIDLVPYPGAWLWLCVDAAVPLLVLRALVVTKERDVAVKALAHASITDALTGLPNRRGFEAAVHAALAVARRQGEPSTVVMFDLDRFKSINDGHGHAEGDRVLKEAAAVMMGNVRASDVTSRLGGEEFALFCPGADTAEAVGIAERVRTGIRDGVPHPAGEGEVVTVSAGVALVEPEAAGLDQALVAADGALYAAKRNGRDRVEVAGGPSLPG